MRLFQLLAATAGIAALAACTDRDEVNMTNVEITAEDNLVVPPADLNVDINADVNADTNATDNTGNTADNTSNNSTNSY